MEWKRVVVERLPAGLVRGLRALRGGARFIGPHASWADAVAAAGGYDSAAILARVRESALAVKRGEAAFERDSVRFAAPEPWPHLRVLERAAIANGGRLRVLDFGGSLGSTYFQCRRDLANLAELRWAVVEQPAFVACGKSELENDQLRFFDSVEAAAPGPPDVALLSSVLQYLPDPGAIARRIAAVKPATILIDRTPAHDRAEDAIWVQHVPPAIYRASYPFRVFGRDRLATLFGPAWTLEEELPGTPFEALESQCGARYVAMTLRRGSDPA